MGGLTAAVASQSFAVDGDLTVPHFETESSEVLIDAGGECGGFDAWKTREKVL